MQMDFYGERLNRRILRWVTAVHVLVLIVLIGAAFVKPERRPQEQVVQVKLVNLPGETRQAKTTAPGDRETARPEPVREAELPKPAPEPAPVRQVEPPKPAPEPTPVRVVEPPKPAPVRQVEPPKPVPTPARQVEPPKPVPMPERRPEPAPEPAPKPKWQPRSAEDIRKSADLREPKPAPRRAESTTPSSPVFDAAAVQSRLKGQIASRVEIGEVSGTPIGGGMASSYLELLAAALYERWNQPTSAETLQARPQVRIRLHIAADGRVLGSDIVTPSGNGGMDNSVRRLLQSLDRVPAFTPDMGTASRQFTINLRLRD